MAGMDKKGVKLHDKYEYSDSKKCTCTLRKINAITYKDIKMRSEGLIQ